MNELIRQATVVLDGNPLDPGLAKALGDLPGEDILDLVSLANRVRNRFSPGFQACSIINAKSGLCSENCRFCAQSASHSTHAQTYPMVSLDVTLAAAETAYAEGVRSFCIVASGYGMTEVNGDLESVLQAIDAIHERRPDMGVSASLGILSETTGRLLAEHRIEHYNINLQTAPGRYRELIAETHTVEERIATIRLLKRHGVQVCSGAILGVGETMDDRIALAFALNDLQVDVIPLNVLVPIAGTPLEEQAPLPAVEVAKTLALFRLINPRAVIKLAAGRETVMNDFQGLLMLAGANGFITGGYLTTRGREVERDLAFARELQGFASAAAAEAPVPR
jgi:biotin synthase